ncbi:hypothetical protein WJX77_000705 [Trebouxia sp. C0004]
MRLWHLRCQCKLYSAIECQEDVVGQQRHLATVGGAGTPPLPPPRRADNKYGLCQRESLITPGVVCVRRFCAAPVL